MKTLRRLSAIGHRFWMPVVVLGLWLCGGSVKAQSVTEPEMIFVAGGTFTMGCTYEQGIDCATDEKPSHEVQITGFTIAKYEVTQALWKQIMGSNPSRFKGDSLPVENVSWDDVQVFLQRLNAKTGKNYRLPTEAEWEYAARGGQQSRQSQYAGGFELETVAWCSTNSENTTHNVGGRQPNELGLYDMSGNVWEWCGDYYGTYPADKQTNPTGAKKGSARVLRGGCYAAIGRQCRVATRKSLFQGGKDYMTGFRLAMDDDREAQAAAAAAAAEQERIAAEKAAEEAARQAEQDRIAAEKKAEQDRIAAEKAAEAAAKQAEQERIAAEKKAEQERIAAEKAAEAAAKKAEQERIAAERQRKAQHRKDSLRALSWNTFFTVNVGASTIPQLSYGFKVGMVKVVGWYFGAMSNFHFKGAFTPFEQNETYVLTGRKKAAKLSCTAGLAVRPCQPLSLHIGAGFGYRALTIETADGWRNYPRRSFMGPEANLGLMFHIKAFALSAEAVYTYNLNPFSDISWQQCIEARIGVGFMLPNKKK